MAAGSLLQAESLRPATIKAEPGEALLRFRVTLAREAGKTWNAEKERREGAFLLGAKAEPRESQKPGRTLS